MSLKTALHALKQLGLAGVDALVYIYLGKKGPQDEKELAISLQITDQQIHNSLRNLQEKGFVTSKNEKQTIFTAVPLERVIDDILKSRTEETQRMEQQKEDFLSNLER